MITDEASGDGPLPCPTCGALVGDAGRHLAWHRGHAPLVAGAVDAGKFGEVLDEVLFQLRRYRREGVL